MITPTARTKVRIEDALWLLDAGTPVQEAARRVGYTVESLHQALSRAGLFRPEVEREKYHSRKARAAA